ncbi:ATP-binding response regulator [Desulfomicrobium escambiense]|uniref:ATP-binding response regulator n=1 Tax=Desulfomicrobium escambiense TaxID=29503 RepID=UPI0009FF9C4F|nr:response regulator [Desulfomicrobium escambiense]
MATNDGSSREGSGCAECARLRGRMESLLEHLRQELESPISSILGVAGLLQNSGLSGEQAEYLRVIRDAAEGMDLVRRSLGDMAWQDTRSALGGEADFDLRVLVHDLAELSRIHARRRNIHFKANVEDEVPSLVRGVPGIVRRITGGFLNRVLHAPGGSNVSMGLGLAERGEGTVTVRLEVRVDARIEPDTECQALSRDLAAQQDGCAGFEAEADSCVFWATFRLPELQARPSSFPPPQPITGRLILAVDTDATWRGVLREYCYLWECPFLEAPDGQAALELLREAAARDEVPDFILAGSNLGSMDMEGFAAAIRTHPELAEARLVALPSSARPGDAARMEAAGFAAYLSRPVEQFRLRDALCLILGARALGRSIGLVTRHVVAEERKRRKIVLVVDPDLQSRALMVRKLDQGGYAHLEAGSGEEALRMLRDNPCALVFLELDLPGMSGLDTARVIRNPETGGDVPVIGTTARLESGDAARCASAGFNEIMVKPVDTQAFFRALEKYVQPNEPGKSDFRGQALDVERLLDQLDHDQVLLADVLQTFLREGRTRVGEFLQALEQGDFPTAEQKSSALRGMAGNIRAEGVRVLAEMAEQACRRSRADKAASLGEEIMQELWRVEQAAALV